MGVRHLLVVTLALAACGGEGSAEARLRGPVTWGEGGGIAGVVHELTVRPDGQGVSANLEHERRFRLSAATRRELEQAVRTARLDSKDSRRTPDGAADHFSYQIAYRGERVRWSSASRKPPARVLRLHVMLSEIYERYAPRCDRSYC